MKEYNLNNLSSRREVGSASTNLPTTVGFLNKLKHFWADMSVARISNTHSAKFLAFILFLLFLTLRCNKQCDIGVFYGISFSLLVCKSTFFF